MADLTATAIPRGPRPRRRLSGRNIMIYGTLLVVSLYYILPLWVMVMTSLKGMPEIRMGSIFAPPVETRAWVGAGEAVLHHEISERPGGYQTQEDVQNRVGE